MRWAGRSACALLAALLLAARAVTFTVDCNHDYADCDKELSKLTDEEELLTPAPILNSTTPANDVYAASGTRAFSAVTDNTDLDDTDTTSAANTTEATNVTSPATPSMRIFEKGRMLNLSFDVMEHLENDNANKTEAEPRTFAKGRLLNLSTDEFPSLANALNNQTAESTNGNTKKPLPDISDVSLDSEDEFDFPPHEVKPEDSRILHKGLSDSFYSNLQAPFMEPRAESAGAEAECTENGVNYKTSERIERGCEESCECGGGARGVWVCTPRCRPPYVRRGRRPEDPLCYETSVDECCSIISCAAGGGANAGSGDLAAVSVDKSEVCRYGNRSYSLGQKWEVGCEQLCSCGASSVITCKPRCGPMKSSEHCISVQDPHDACCQVQVCDVTHDAHELEPVPASTAPPPPPRPTAAPATVPPTTAPPTTAAPPATGASQQQQLSTLEDRMDHFFNDIAYTTKLPSRPPPPVEPVTSIVVLRNGTVQVNFARLNTSLDPYHLQISMDGGRTFQDLQLTNGTSALHGLKQGLDYVLRNKDTTKSIEFTVPVTDTGMNDLSSSNDIVQGNNTTGCVSEGIHYDIGEEFRIGCSELCECVGVNQSECATLQCPSHVGLELVSPTCVRWAPDPPDWQPRPPACCPTRMRCLSDGSCDYHGRKIPNWSEVPISLTGCEQRCFCESGTLDCQNICSALPPVPPQTLRCQPGFKPAPVDIAHDDCCKQWGCTSIEESYSPMQQPIIHSMQSSNNPLIHPINYVTPLPPPSTKHHVSVPTIPADEQHLWNPIHDHRKFVLEIKPMAIYSKYMKHPNPLIKLHTNTGGDGIFQMHPKLQNSKNFTKSLRPLMPTVPFKLPESQLVPYAIIDNQKVLPESSGKYPTSNKPIRQSMPNYLPEEQEVGAAGKSQQPERTVRFTAINPNSMSNPAALLLPNIAEQHHKYRPSPVLKDNKHSKNSVRYFEPNMNRTKYVLPHAKPMLISASPSRNITHKASHVPHTKQIQLTHHRSHRENASIDHNNHAAQSVLQKAPNPYQSVLHRPLTPRPVVPLGYDPDSNTYTTQDLHPTIFSGDLEELLRQLDQVEPPAPGPAPGPTPVPVPDHSRDVPTQDSRRTGGHYNAGSPHDFPPPANKLPPPFVPTPLPEIPYPSAEELPDYDQSNNIHRPPSPEKPPPYQPPQPPPRTPDPPPALPPPSPKFPPLPTFTLPPPPTLGAEPTDNSKLSLMSLAADTPTSVKILFELPSVLVGLRGSLDLRYTDKEDEDVSRWYSQVFAPTDEVLTTARLEFRLTGLKPSTTYRLRGKLYLHNLQLEPTSGVYSVRTLDPPPVVEEKRRAVDTGLRLEQLNATSAQLSWRHFTDDELQYIDGIQVRYRRLEQPIYSMTELLHHGRREAELRDLRSGAAYEASLVLVPPPRSPLELYDAATLNFTTPPFHDMYNWSVVLEAQSVAASAVRVTWRGVPAPPERYVRVYRAAHACGDAPPPHRERDTFKLADRDQPPQLLLTGLRSNSKCRIWLELFLTNGKVKISNVLDITTKSEEVDHPLDNEVQASSVAGSRAGGGGGGGARGDYYGALVVVGVVAALGALTSLLLLLVVVRRHRPHSVSITTVPSAPRAPSLPPYDNPAYKLELQQETMDL